VTCKARGEAVSGDCGDFVCHDRPEYYSACACADDGSITSVNARRAF